LRHAGSGVVIRSVATIAERITELEAELVAVKAALTSARSGGQSFTVDGQSYSSWSMSGLRDERTRIEKSIQRLLRGGRGMPVDLSQAANGGTNTSNPFRSGSEVLL
jgi:hypothetical protein